MFLEKTNETEVKNIVKSAGVDGIRAIDLKNNIEHITPIITQLINKSLNESTIPDLLKISIISPIFKNGNKSEYGNYRPI